MKRLALALVLAAMASPALAGVPLPQIPTKGTALYVELPNGTYLPLQGDSNGNAGASWIPQGFLAISVGSSAVGMTAPGSATWCVFTVESNAVRWRDDGTNPTASVGFPQAVGDKWVYSGNLAAIKFIQQSAGGTVDAECYK